MAELSEHEWNRIQSILGENNDNYGDYLQAPASQKNTIRNPMASDSIPPPIEKKPPTDYRSLINDAVLNAGKTVRDEAINILNPIPYANKIIKDVPPIQDDPVSALNSAMHAFSELYKFRADTAQPSINFDPKRLLLGPWSHGADPVKLIEYIVKRATGLRTIDDSILKPALNQAWNMGKDTYSNWSNAAGAVAPAIGSGMERVAGSLLPAMMVPYKQMREYGDQINKNQG